MSSNTTPVENHTITRMDARLGWIRGKRSWVRTEFHPFGIFLIVLAFFVILGALNTCGTNFR